MAVPEGWRPARLGLRYLYLEDEDGPAFEFKWRTKAGRKGMEAALRALTPKGRAVAGVALPKAWLDALAGFECMPLSWKQAGRSGLGAALFCPQCGLAAVFQGFGGPDGPDPDRTAVLARVLASLAHHDPEPFRFRLYGLSLTAPQGFALAAFSFAPGRFVLNFAVGRRRLDAVRLAPADVLLAGQDLAGLAGRHLGLGQGARFFPDTVRGLAAVWGEVRQGRGLTDCVARGLGRQGRVGVLWHDPAANKLLGLAATDARPVDRAWIEAVAANYVSL